MALGAQRLEIIPVVRTAVRQLDIVMNNSGWIESAFIPAQFTQWMGRYECGTNLLPRSAVVFVALTVADMAVVMLLSRFRVLGAVPAAHQLWTAMTSAGLHGFVGHDHTSGQDKSPRSLAPKALNHQSFSSVILSQDRTLIPPHLLSPLRINGF